MDREIITEKLTKTYHTFKKEEGFKGAVKALFVREKINKTAMDLFDLTVDKGEFVGLIGPNGAGKTTLIKMLTGIIEPDSGKISIGGYTPCKRKDEFKKKFAVVMGQKSQLWWDLPAIDTFILNKAIYEIPDAVYRENLNYFTNLLGLKDLLNIQVRNLSLGERMKMELVSSLLHAPEILFLDEPSIGLDTVAQKQLRSFLKEINADKKVTIMLTSHYIEDIKHLCPRVVVIRTGKKIYDGSLSGLLEKFQEFRIITVSFENETALSLSGDMEMIEQNPFRYVIRIPKRDTKNAVHHLMANHDVDDIKIDDEDISGIVEKIYRSSEGQLQ
jgi:ABC-2 type transport system ATP-binding protein